MPPDARTRVAHGVLLMLRRWPVVFGFALVFFLLALVYAATRAKAYESTAMVIVTPAPFQQSGAVDASADGDQFLSFAELVPPSLPPEVLRELALSPALLAQVIAVAGLEDTTTEQLARRASVELELLRRSGAVTASPSLLFRVKAGDPDRAADILRAWTRLFKERVDALHTFKLDETYGLVQDMRKVAEENLATAENALETFQKDWNLSLLDQRRESKEAALLELESALVRLELDIAKKDAAVAKVEELLAETPDRITLRHTEPGTAGADAAAEAGEGAAAVLQDEVLNPLRVHLEQKRADETQLLNSLQTRRDEALQQLKTLEKEIEELQNTIAEQTVVQNRLVREAQSYKQVFELSSVSRGKAELTRVIRASDVYIAADATVPRSPMPANHAPLVLAATLLGAALGMGYVLFSGSRLAGRSTAVV
jgi:uncharacterized protein involved in exopolysaccharide biosynthesis